MFQDPTVISISFIRSLVGAEWGVKMEKAMQTFPHGSMNSLTVNSCLEGCLLHANHMLGTHRRMSHCSCSQGPTVKLRRKTNKPAQQSSWVMCESVSPAKKKNNSNLSE